MSHNAELGGFLRSHRDRLRPAEAGLPARHGGRRVPGLRREEVAELAGVSAAYYTRLEQGRHPHVSQAVLDSVARALRLDDAERDHLHALVRSPHPRTARHTAPTAPTRARPEVHEMLDTFDRIAPALVLNHRFDVLAANRLARALLTDFDALPYRDRNLARHILLAPEARGLYADWEAVARGIVANLRRTTISHPGDRLLDELVGEVRAGLPQFEVWWSSHRVKQCTFGIQRLRHPLVGALNLRHQALTFSGEPDQNLHVWPAEPGSPDAENLALLASWSAEEARDRHTVGPAEAKYTAPPTEPSRPSRPSRTN